MTEREIQTKIVAGAKKEGFNLFKIIDAPATGKKPFDISGIAPNGIGVALEVKKINKLQAYIAWSLFSPHQIDWLKFYAEARAYALAAIYVEETSVLHLIRLYPEDFSTIKNGIVLQTPSEQMGKARQGGDNNYYGLKEFLDL